MHSVINSFCFLGILVNLAGLMAIGVQGAGRKIISKIRQNSSFSA
jgi:hypothetical protein